MDYKNYLFNKSFKIIINNSISLITRLRIIYN